MVICIQIHITSKTNVNLQTNKGVIDVEPTTDSWQEQLAQRIESLSEQDRQRVHDYLMGYLAAVNSDNRSQTKRSAS